MKKYVMILFTLYYYTLHYFYISLVISESFRYSILFCVYCIKLMVQFLQMYKIFFYTILTLLKMFPTNVVSYKWYLFVWSDSLILYCITCLFPCDVLPGTTDRIFIKGRVKRRRWRFCRIGIDGPVKANTDLSALMGYLSSVQPYSLSLSMFAGTG